MKSEIKKIKIKLQYVLLTLLIASYSSYSAKFVVLTKLDSGGGSIIDEISPEVFTIDTLRSAIEQAENETLFPGGDTITFDIPITPTHSTIILSQVGDTFDILSQTSNSAFGINSTITINGDIPNIAFNTQLAVTGSVELRHFQVNAGGKLKLQNIKLQGGQTPLNSAGRGGAIVVQNNAKLEVYDSTFSLNDAVNGGAISFQSGAKASAIYRSKFSFNKSSDEIAATENGAGGAIFTENTSEILTIEGTSFYDNAADANGGALYIDGLVNISRSSIYSNSSDLNGGGVYIDTFGSTTITNSLIYDNLSQLYGGGLYIDSTNQMTKIISSTIVDNHSGGQLTKLIRNAHKGTIPATSGGGIFSYFEDTFIMHNSIVAENKDTGVDNDIEASVNNQSSYNLIGVDVSTVGITDGNNGNIIGTAFSPIDPLIEYGVLFDVIGIKSNSPAVNTGSNSIVIVENITTDYRGDGYDRIVGSATDIGAYELDLIFYNGFE